MRRSSKSLPRPAARAGVAAAVAAAAIGMAGCGPDDSAPPVAGAHVAELPGAARPIDFDDIAYSQQLRKLLVPARRSGLYLVDPDSGRAARLGRLAGADSADAGRGLIFVLRRDDRAIDVLDPDSGRVVTTAKTSAPGDYIRYIAATDELWVTEPAASPSGIEIFALPPGPHRAPHRAGFVPVPDGPEGLTPAQRSATVYTHAGSRLVAVAAPARTITARWPTGCDATHGFPRLDKSERLVLASCAHDDEVSLLDARDGRQLGRFAAGGGEALPAYSTKADHFYVRGDPGTTLVTLAASPRGLERIRDVDVPKDGHCLTADTVGHYWTCDAKAARVLGFDDP